MSENNQAVEELRPVPKRHRSDPVGTAAFAVFLIWVGALWLLSNIGLVDPLIRFVERFNLPPAQLGIHIPFLSADVWQVFLLGAGCIALLEILLRLAIPGSRRGVVGTVIWAAILFGLALGNWSLILPAGLILAGIVLLFRRALGG